MRVSYLAKYGPHLLEAGYSVIPIKRGSKAPEGDKWQKIVATPKLVEAWIPEYPAGGVGVLTARTPLVDLDIYNRDIASQMVSYVQEWYGPAPVRIGQAPKTGLLFRTPEPFAKVQSGKWVDEWQQEHKVEILGRGQQFVAYHIHKDTLRPYTWPEGDPPPAADLPVLTEANAKAIVAEFERVARKAGWTPKRRTVKALAVTTKGGRIDTEDVFASDAPRIEDLSEDQIAAKLMLVPGSDDYDTWFQIGMALYHQFEGAERGLELWHEWSQDAGNYDPDALDAKWPTFAHEGKGRRPITAKIILKLAKETEQEIAVEKYGDVKSRLEVVEEVALLEAICLEVKSIRFQPLQRAEIVSLVRKAFSRITKGALSVAAARAMTRFENPELKDAPWWLQPFVYVANGNLMWDRKNRFGYPITAFDNTHNRHMLSATDRLEGKASPDVRASEFALNVVRVETVAQAIYMPGQDDTFEFNGLKVVNSYTDRNVPEIPDRLRKSEAAAIEMVKGHFAHLFANERDRAILLDGIAYIVQNPGKRINFGFMLQGVEGDGKTVFARLLAAVLGGDNVKSIPAQALEEKFTSWAEGAQALFIEEIKLQGHNRFDVLNKVKPLLTNATIAVRKMNTDIYEAPNTATYFLLTNYVDALPLTRDDSRYFILFSRFQTRDALAAFLLEDPTYYDRLHDAIDNHAGALRKWLLEHQIDPSFNPHRRAPQSAGKDAMIRHNQSEEMEALAEILAESKSRDLCDTLLSTEKLSAAFFDRDIDLPVKRAMGKMLQDAGFQKLGRIRMPGSSQKSAVPYYWSRDVGRFLDKKGEVVNTLVQKFFKDGDVGDL